MIAWCGKPHDGEDVYDGVSCHPLDSQLVSSSHSVLFLSTSLMKELMSEVGFEFVAEYSVCQCA